MSAFLAFIGHADGQRLEAIVRGEAERAPDGIWTHASGSAWFGHASLVDGDPARSLQCLARGDLTVVADARIDEPVASSDAAAILDAYSRWGSDAPAHLTGDFAYVIHDAATGVVHAARDFLGIRPLFYTLTENALVLASTINMIRALPGHRDELLEESIVRYLAGSSAEVPEATFYRGIRRLLPGHAVRYADGCVTTLRHWTVNPEASLRFRRHDDYVEHFTGIFDRAVADRIRGRSVAVMMSGGLDSTSVAATARHVRPDLPIEAFTTNFSRLFADDEALYAGEAAAALGLEHHVFERGTEVLFGDRSTFTRAEPFEDPLAEVFLSISREASRWSRVILGGLGGDTLFRTSTGYFRDLIRRGRLLRAITDVGGYVLRRRQLPPLGLRSWVLRRPSWKPAFPAWLRPEVVERFSLREEFERWLEPTAVHPVRPEAARWVFDPFWSRYFETWDPGETRIPVDVTHPILDKRLVEALLAYPPMPWFADKYLMRAAMAGRLPDRLRLRPKTTLAGDPLAIAVRNSLDDIGAMLQSAPMLDAYIDRDALLGALGSGTGDLRAVLPLTFARWWRSRQQDC